MTDDKIKLIIGSLLHDVGKILYRADDGRNHSISGYDFLKAIPGFDDEDILRCVKYHHSGMIYGMIDRPEKGLFYKTYIADNIAAFIDRRKNDNGDKGFVREAPLDSVFNILNGNKDNLVYPPGLMSENIVMPEEKDQVSYSEDFYRKVVFQLQDLLQGIEISDGYVNSLLEVMESTLSFVPSSTNQAELTDISLYDHCKMTAALASCIYDYCYANEIENDYDNLYRNADAFYDKPAFILYSMDVSGIQDFIYTISSKGALKGLRARSFYLEMILQHAVDELLLKLSLSRANLLYLGGGHAYMLLPNEDSVKECLISFEQEMNNWFMNQMDTSLYIAGGCCECSANQLRNVPEGSYGEVFKTISNKISETKSHRYNATQIRMLNSRMGLDRGRECSICRRTDVLNEDGKCSICSGLEKLSGGIIQDRFISVLEDTDKSAAGISLPFDKRLMTDHEESLLNRIKNSSDYVRSYSKNKWYTGYNMVSKIWLGDYVSSKEFKELAEASHGIKRLAVLRADVDNLGKAFIRGFAGDKSTISRTSTFSRKLSAFFKLYINRLLESGKYHLNLEVAEAKRHAAVVYSGGDDMFVVGAWDDILGFAIDLYRAFNQFTQGTLSLSAGIGIYHASYPISAMARETGELEDLSKLADGKNSCTLFAEGHTYHWDELINEVIGEKMHTLQSFLRSGEDHGNALLYRMLELIRDRDAEDRLNIARFAYLLARLEPDAKADDLIKEEYKEFSRKMYRWIQNEKDRRQLITAIYIYVYYYRGEEEK